MPFFRKILVMVVCACLFSLAPSALRAQDRFTDGNSFANAIENFVVGALEQSGQSQMSFDLAGDQLYTVEVIIMDEGPALILMRGGETGAFPPEEGDGDFARFRRFLDTFRDYMFIAIPPFERQIEAGRIISELPGGPLDEVFSQVALGRTLDHRLFVDLATQRAAEAAASGATAVTDRVAAIMRYTRFHYKGTEGNVIGLTMGALRQTENVRYGLLVPYDRIDFDDSAEDADSFSVAPYVQVILLDEPVMIAVGPYLYYNYTFINDTPDFSMWGGGLAGSVEAEFDPMWVRVGISGEYFDANVNHSVNNVVRLRGGGMVGFPLFSENLEGRLFALGTLADEEFLGGDDEYASAGGEVIVTAGEAFAVTLGYLRSVGHEHLSSFTAYLGGVFLLK
jgi:hypothetical protein